MKGKGPTPSSKKEEFPQNWLLCGADPRFFEEPGARWAKRWGGEEGAVSFPAPGMTPSAFHTEVNSLPFLKERQVVRIPHLEGASKELLEAVAGYCERPSPTTALLLEYLGSAPSPDKKASKSATPSAPGPLERIFASVPHRACQPKYVKEYATQRLSDAGFRAGPGMLDALDEWAVKDVARAAAALDLLLLYRAGEGILREEDVAALLGAGGPPARYLLTDAFVARDGKRFRDLLRQVEADPEVQGDPAGTAIGFLGMVAKQVRALLVACGSREAGQSRQETFALLARDPFRMKDFAAGKVFDALPHWPEAEIRGTLGTLFRLDLALKGGAEPAPPWTLVERYLTRALSGG